MIDKSWQLFSARSSRESGLSRSPSHTTGRAGPHPAVHQVLYGSMDIFLVNIPETDFSPSDKADAVSPLLLSGSIPIVQGNSAFVVNPSEILKIYVLLDV